MSKILNALSPVAAIASGVNKTNKNLKKEIANRPKYDVAGEYSENKNLAANQAYARDRAVQNQEERIDQSAANAFDNAQQTSNSQPALLAALTGINANTSAAKNDLVDQEQQNRARGMGMMMQTNNQIAEEKDKAWNYNTNEPYQDRKRRLAEKQKFNRELGMKAVDLAGSLAVKAATGGVA